VQENPTQIIKEAIITDLIITDILIIHSFGKSGRNEGKAYTQKDKSNTFSQSELRDVDPYQSSKAESEST